MRRLPFKLLSVLMIGFLFWPAGARAEADPSITIGFLPPSTSAEWIILRGSAPRNGVVEIAVNGKVERVHTNPSMDVYNTEVQLQPGENQISVTLAGTKTGVEKAIFRTTASFSDIDAHWAKNDIEILATLGVINGKGDGAFGPEDGLTRAQFAKLMVLGLDLKPADSATALPFADKAEIPEWAASYIATAVEHGLIKGYEDGTFKPNAPVSRVEVAVIASRGLRQKRVTPNRAARPFADQAAIPAWASADVDLATSTGVIESFWGERFEPGSQATRAIAAAVVRRLKFAHGHGEK